MVTTGEGGAHIDVVPVDVITGVEGFQQVAHVDGGGGAGVACGVAIGVHQDIGGSGVVQIAVVVQVEVLTGVPAIGYATGVVGEEEATHRVGSQGVGTDELGQARLTRGDQHVRVRTQETGIKEAVPVVQDDGFRSGPVQIGENVIIVIHKTAGHRAIEEPVVGREIGEIRFPGDLHDIITVQDQIGGIDQGLAGAHHIIMIGIGPVEQRGHIVGDMGVGPHVQLNHDILVAGVDDGQIVPDDVSVVGLDVDGPFGTVIVHRDEGFIEVSMDIGVTEGRVVDKDGLRDRHGGGSLQGILQDETGGGTGSCDY